MKRHRDITQKRTRNDRNIKKRKTRNDRQWFEREIEAIDSMTIEDKSKRRRCAARGQES